MYRYSEEWELIDFKVNENYRTCCNDTPLYCECGKELKYQYILRSKSKDTIMKLGIEHFKNIVAFQIVLHIRLERVYFC